MNYELPQLLSESLVAEGVTDHHSLRALPHGSIDGNLRLTKQGETIGQKYANLGTARY